MAIRPTRISVNIKAAYTLKGSQGEGNIVDISTGGIGIEVKQIFVLGDLIRVIFHIPDQHNDEIDFWGIVRNVTGNLIGLKYEEISKENMEKIEHYVSSLILQTGRNARESI